MRLPNAHTGIAFHKVPIGGDGHGADDFPLAGVVIEAPERAFLPWAGFDVGDIVREVREADGGKGRRSEGTGSMPILPPRVPSSLKTA